MTQILHIFGKQGVGKSTLAEQIKVAYRARGVTCENLTELSLHEPGWNTNLKPFRTGTEWDVLIAEHQDEAFPGQVEPGDLLIRLERAQ